MTLILSCITKDYAIQVSDRCLTDLSTGKLVPEEANKAVLFSHSVAFGYTGLASITPTDKTDMWLVKILQKSGVSLVSEAVKVIQDAATNQISSLKLQNSVKRLAFVGVGWVFNKRRLSPKIYQISNFSAGFNKWLHQAKPTFEIKEYSFKFSKRNLFNISIAGQELIDDEKTQLESLLRQQINTQNDPNQIAKILAETIYRVAERNKTVGKNLMILCLPRIAIGKPLFYMSDGSPAFGELSSLPITSKRTFFYLSDTNKTIYYGPHNVGGGTALTDFRIESTEKGTSYSIGITFPEGSGEDVEKKRLKSAYKKGCG